MTPWPEVRLAEVATSIDYGINAGASAEARGPRLLRITDIQDDDVDWGHVPRCAQAFVPAMALRPGDIVFARTGATTGKSFLVRACPDDALFASYLIRVRLNDDFEPRFVSRFFGTPRYWAQISQSARGVAQPGVNATVLGGLRLPSPPLAEQRRIADILDRADALRAKRREAIGLFEEMGAALFVESFGDPASNPKRWPVESFGAVCDTRLGKMLDHKRQTGANRRPYLRNANVQWFRFELDSVFEMDFDESDRNVLRLQVGDLLICEGGEPGRAAIWQGELSECYFQKALHRARPNPALAAPEYLCWLLWLMTRQGTLAGVTSATIAHLTGEKLAKVPVILPPLVLQQRFVAAIDSIDKLKAAHRASLAEMDALFASLQHRAFRGEL